jgi:hypothetical protein
MSTGIILSSYHYRFVSRAAFFRGQIEHPGQAVIKSVKDDPVFVAINPCGIFIIDMDDSVHM